MWGMWAFGMFVWLLGIFLLNTHTTKNVHETYWKMWGARLDAFGVAFILMLHIKVNFGDWEAFNTLYTVLMSFIFLSNAVREYTIRGIFNIQAYEHRKKFENK